MVNTAISYDVYVYNKCPDIFKPDDTGIELCKQLDHYRLYFVYRDKCDAPRQSNVIKKKLHHIALNVLICFFKLPKELYELCKVAT